MAKTPDNTPGGQEAAAPLGARGFPGRGSHEGERITLAELSDPILPYTPQSLDEVIGSRILESGRATTIIRAVS